ncbi:MAG: hypothetical protein KC620_12995 [Myxococcales bacterium]|nr:hypothetical protein [Myxococcales bacterium]
MARNALRLFVAPFAIALLVNIAGVLTGCGSPEEFPDDSDFVIDQQTGELRLTYDPIIVTAEPIITCNPRSTNPDELCNGDEGLPSPGGLPMQCEQTTSKCNDCSTCGPSMLSLDPIAAQQCSAACSYCDRCNGGLL